MTTIPHYSSREYASVRVLIDDSIDPEGDSITLDSGNVDAGQTPTSLFGPGNVVIKRASTGRYVEANDANADDLGFPSITTSGHGDATADIVLVGNHGTISVTVSTGTGTEANCATDLNADDDFKPHYKASSSGGELTITARNAGPEEWFYMDATTSDTYGFAEGEANAVQGTLPDVRVTADYADLEVNGAAAHAEVRAYRRGHFDESALTNLTAKAKAILAGRGSIFG